MKKEIIILGDIEMGGGTLTDDFISDKALSQLILSLVDRPHPIDLVLNGDTFDFLKCPYFSPKGRIYPRHISPDISLSKLGHIRKAHHAVFETLKKYARSPHKRIFFVIGNHDPDLFFPEVQQELRRILGKKKNIFFCWFYHRDGVYVEHGQQYDFLNKINPRVLFFSYHRKKILNIPWVSFGLISRFMTLKEKHPFLERIKPLPLLFSHHKAVAKKISWRTLEYFTKSTLYYPWRYWRDPTYIFPKWLFREFYRRFTNKHWEVDEVMNVFKRKKRTMLRQNKLYVLGHIHEKRVEQKEGWTILHPDTWRDEYILDGKTKLLTAKTKQYVQVLIRDNDKLEWQLQTWPLARKALHLDTVIKDELKALAIAAREEGYAGTAVTTFS